MAATKLTGIFDIELFESHGDFYLNEVNLRYGAAGYAVTAMGINLPGIYADYHYGRSFTFTDTIQDGKVFVIHAEADDFTAVGKVYQQPLERYVRNSRAAVVFRLQSPHPVLEDPALAAAAIRQYLSCPFDAAFDLKTPKSLYCTELVYRFFADITPAIHLKTKRYFWKECVPVDSCCDPDFFAELQTLKK